MSMSNPIVTIRTRPVGQSFGTVGQLVSTGRSRKVIAESDITRPYGCTGAAYDDAMALAVERGMTVVDDDGELILRDGVRVGRAS